MGGYGSGQWRTARYATVEDSCVFDIAWLRRCGALRLGQSVSSHSSWSRDGDHVVSIRWLADLWNPAAPHMRLRYHAAETRIDDYVRLEATSPAFGGTRWWFTCPSCGRRCAKLHLPAAPEDHRRVLAVLRFLGS